VSLSHLVERAMMWLVLKCIAASLSSPMAASPDFEFPHSTQNFFHLLRFFLRGRSWPHGATLELKASGLAELMSQPAVTHGYLEGEVALTLAYGQRLTTTSAHYDRLRETVKGDAPVTLMGEGLEVLGRGGFSLHLDQEAFDLYGPVKGVAKTRQL
jgi:hypothetical protein